jgi:hypothetical protein
VSYENLGIKGGRILTDLHVIGGINVLHLHHAHSFDTHATTEKFAGATIFIMKRGR